MKILVYGIGAMGSIYASLLSRSSNEVFVVDPWKEHISEIKKNGLKMRALVAIILSIFFISIPKK